MDHRLGNAMAGLVALVAVSLVALSFAMGERAFAGYFHSLGG
jgi:hypothetical protein